MPILRRIQILFLALILPLAPLLAGGESLIATAVRADVIALRAGPASRRPPIGFAPKQPQAKLSARQMEQGLAALRRSGHDQAILARYGLEE